MKIVFITREDYNLAGARIRCYNFAEILKKFGIKTKVLSFADNLGAYSGVNEKKLMLKDKIKYNVIAFNELLKEKNAVFILNRFNYHSFSPWILSKLNGHKLVLDLDDWEIREDPRYYLKIWPKSKAEFLTRIIAQKSDICIGASKFLVNYLSKFNKETYYIPSGVDINKFRPSRINIKSSKTVFSWIGTMHRRDNIENIKFIINCFLELKKRHKNISLEIVGDGIYRCLLEEKNIKSQDVVLKNWIKPKNISDYINSVDIGLVPLIQNTKFNKAKSPVKLFEYMAMAKPTVSSYIGEPSLVIEDGVNGFLAKDKRGFIKKMEKLVLDKELSQKIGKRARKSVEKKFSLQILTKRVYEILTTKLT